MSFTIQKLEFGDEAKINAVARMFIESYDSTISRYLRYADIHYINKFCFLDVFEKTTAALAWYHHLGMAITATNYLTHYYTHELPETTQTNKAGNELSIQPDEFGLSQVLSNNIRIATVLNENTLITRALPRPSEMLNLRNFFGDKLNALCLITDRKLNFPIIDRSFRMIKEFEKMDKK